MIAKCPCQHCGNPIEFEAEHTGAVVTCPHCGKETALGFTKPAQPAPIKTSQPKASGGRFAIYAAGVTFLLAVSIAGNAFLWKQASQVPGLQSQITGLQSQITGLNQQLAEKHQALITALQSNVAQDQKGIEATICGVYEFQESYMNAAVSSVDIRSDYTALVAFHGGPARRETWKMEGDKISVSGHLGTLSIEGDDLIDSKGNRWLRTR